jgi:hypothetical protein
MTQYGMTPRTVALFLLNKDYIAFFILIGTSSDLGMNFSPVDILTKLAASVMAEYHADQTQNFINPDRLLSARKSRFIVINC